MIDPSTDPDAWDYAVLGGIPTPGLCIIKGASKVLGWDKRKGQGTSGASTVYTGDELTEFSMRLELYPGVRGLDLRTQLDVIDQELLPVLAAASSGKSAVDFYHPAVADPPVDVRAVVPVDLGQLEQEGDLWTWTVKFLQFKKPKPAIGKPSASKSKGGTSKDQTTAKDAIDEEIEALTKQVKNAANEVFG